MGNQGERAEKRSVNMFGNRCRRLNHELGAAGLDAVLISSPSNLRYYTGFTGGEAFFIMPVGEMEDFIKKPQGEIPPEKETDTSLPIPAIMNRWKRNVRSLSWFL